MKSPQVKLGQRRARREYVQAHRRAAIFLCKPPHPAAAGRGRLRPAMPVARRRFERSVREDAACLRARGSRLERRRLRRRVSRKCVGRCVVRRGRRPQCVHGAPPLPATAASSWARGKRDLDGASTILGRMRCGRFETPVAAPRAGRAQRATLDAHTRECAMLMLEAPAQPLPAWPGTEWGAGAGRYVGGEACASGRGARGAACPCAPSLRGTKCSRGCPCHARPAARPALADFFRLLQSSVGHAMCRMPAPVHPSMHPSIGCGRRWPALQRSEKHEHTSATMRS